MGDLTARRGFVQDIEQRAGAMVISADVPLPELLGYANQLRRNTQGRAEYSMNFARYEMASGGMSLASMKLALPPTSRRDQNRGPLPPLPSPSESQSASNVRFPEVHALEK